MKPGHRTVITNVLLIVSFALFTLGVFSPLMAVKKWFIFENTFSLLAGLMQFFHAGQYVLFIIVATFSLVVPLAKIILIAVVANKSLWITSSSRVSLLHWLSLCGKWSMVDGFIVAIVIVAGKFRGLAEVEIHYGLYAFAASVILIHITTCSLDTLERRVSHQDGAFCT